MGCPEGWHKNGAGSWDTVCEACEAGAYSLAAKAECTDCPVGWIAATARLAGCTSCAVRGHPVHCGGRRRLGGPAAQLQKCVPPAPLPCDEEGLAVRVVLVWLLDGLNSAHHITAFAV